MDRKTSAMFLSDRSFNGVKEMRGFRETFNISFNQDDLNETDGAMCGSTDDLETSALLVRFQSAP